MCLAFAFVLILVVDALTCWWVFVCFLFVWVVEVWVGLGVLAFRVVGISFSGFSRSVGYCCLLEMLRVYWFIVCSNSDCFY